MAKTSTWTVGRAMGILGGVALLALVAVAAWPRAVEVDRSLTRRGGLEVWVEEDGRTRVRDRYLVSAPTAGSLARLETHAGDTVEAGAVLARLAPLASPLLDPRSRATAEARLAAARAAEAQARATVTRAEGALAFASQERTRQQTLTGAGASARVALDQAEFEERVRRDDLRSARFAADVARHELQMAQAALSHRGGAPEELQIAAPLSGTVLRVIQESEGAVAAGSPLLELGDPAALEVVVDLLTADAVRVRPGARVLLSGWGGPELEGRVRTVEPSAFTRLSALGVEEQRVNALIELGSPREAWLALGDGFRIEARIQVGEVADCVVAPESALFRVGRDWAVYRLEGGRARETRVEVGERNGREAEIRAGLEAGQALVAYPGDRVVDGARVVGRGD